MPRGLIFGTLCTVSALLCSYGSASAALLGTYTVNNVELGIGVSRPTVDFPLSYGGSANLGGNLNLAGSTSQRQFTFASNADDPGYSAFVTDLTDGVNESLSAFIVLHGLGLGNGNNPLESAAFGGHPDFAGNHIDDIVFTVDPFQIINTPPQSGLPNGATSVINLAGTGGFSYNWQVFGETVPEPGSAAMLVASLLLLRRSAR